MSGLDTYVALDALLATRNGATCHRIARHLDVTPRHARRMVDKMRTVFGAVWDLQIIERVVNGSVFYRYRTCGASAFTVLARRVAS